MRNHKYVVQGFHPTQLAHTSSEDEWESLDPDSSSSEEEVDKRDELKAPTERVTFLTLRGVSVCVVFMELFWVLCISI